MEQPKPLVDSTYLLEKFPGKGGWTFAQIPEVLQDKHAYFGWVRVRGSIDGVEFKGHHLMPMGNGKLFLTVKSAIRKKIGKQAGDTVHVVLFADNLPTEIPEELAQCLVDVPSALESFELRADGEKKAMIEWIYSAKTEQTKANRIAKLIAQLIGE